MTSVYGVFANDGIRNPYQSILSVQDNTGKVLEQFEANGKQLISQNSTRILSDILSDNTARTPTFGANSVLNIPGRDVAVKTGTTNDNKDAWTIGYTPSVAVGVWVGNNDNVPMKKGGAALAGPIWNAVMTEALKNLPNESFPKPEQIDPVIPAVLRGFWQGGETFIVDTVSGGLATDSTPSEFRQEKSITNVHTILYWLNKNNPLQKTSKETGDSQFKNWEYGVKNWWEKNKSNYQIITEDDIPKFSDSVHTNEAKPEITINEINNKIYSKNDTVGLSLSVTSKNPIKKVDVFINSTYVTSLKYWPFETNINLSTVDGLQKTNTLRVVGVDALGNANEKSAIFFIAD
jgi:penicillin-binding protein 1A